MARAKFQILLIPYLKKNEVIEYCIFKRKDLGIWQFIAGGGEDDEIPLEAAKREGYEEAKIDINSKYVQLKSITSISTEFFTEKHREIWGKETLVIPEYSFSVELRSKEIIIAEEHTEFIWVTYEEAKNLLKWDSNKTALWELDNIIKMSLL